MKNNYVVIMAGGVGSRFWPYSRNTYPKQFLDIFGTGKSLLRHTYERFLKVAPNDHIYIVTNELYGALVAEQLPELSPGQILKEPQRKNTAPCIAYAAYKIASENPDANMVVAPSDHAILQEDAFAKDVQVALEATAKSNKIVTIGIKPHKPETGFGYIQFDASDSLVKPVKNFTEKPELEKAKEFLASGDYVWNAGIFVWSVRTIVNSFESYAPTLAGIFRAGKDHYYQPSEQSFLVDAFDKCEDISIDFAVMEKAKEIFMVQSNFDWSDLGSWSSLHQIREKDENNNVVSANALLFDCKDTLVQGDPDQLIVVQGLEGYLVASCGNSILICKKDDERQFRVMHKAVKSQKSEEFH